MLETIRSRQIYGFLVLTILPGKSSLFSLLTHPTTNPLTTPTPASALLGYHLRTRTEDLTLTTTPSPTLIQLQDRLNQLERREAQLSKESLDLNEKLIRVGVTTTTTHRGQQGQ